MSSTTDSDVHDTESESATIDRTDVRTIFPHESWRDVYALLGCETSIETSEDRL